MFGAFERAVAGRYLRARKGERFVSIIAIFSLIGIALGVATLIVVTSVMSGFQTALITRFLGVERRYQHRGLCRRQDRRLCGRWRSACAPFPGVVSVLPVLEGQALLSVQNGGARGALVRGITARICAACPRRRPHCRGQAGRFAGR